ncbi:MAG: hypothetical protein JJU28_18160 [Cyclobacteriaceae bacterium]|nr:hypothetical protein [Cyclobacteriaceae bacterium]
MRTPHWLNTTYHHMIASYLKNKKDKKLIIFTGLKRSGNHAIINWIIGQEPGVIGFYNDLPIEKSMFKGQMESHFSIVKTKFPASVICSYEDKLPKDVFSNKNINHIKKTFGHFQSIIKIILIRDPFNYFSSRMHHHNNIKLFSDNPETLLDNINKWKIYARTIIMDKNIHNYLFINYNDWVLNLQYRKKISTLIGVKFNDIRFLEQSKYGKGSSFQMNNREFLSRWKKSRNLKIYKDIFKDKELIELYTQLFTELEGVNEFLTNC